MRMTVHRLARFVLVIAVLPATLLGQTVEVRVATFNILFFDPDDPTQLNAVVAILDRVRPDVVCVQEFNAISDLAALATAAGYSYNYLAATSYAIDSSLRTGVMSNYPFSAYSTRAAPYLSGDSGARDLTRNFVVVEVDVPEATEDLVLIGNHWKASSGDVNEFRRSIESIRAMQATDEHNSTTVPYLLLGDMNDSLGTSHTPDPFTESWYNTHSGEFPISYELGNDIVFPVDNGTFKPLQAGTGSQALTVIIAYQLDGGLTTMVSGSSRLDYIWHSDAVTVSGAEVYDSRDEGLPGGLPKYGSALPYGTSDDASDHLMVFADLEIPAVPQAGACCQPGGICTNGLTQTECDSAGGHFYGLGSDCSGPLDPPCEAPGACCLVGGTCVDNEESYTCINSNGYFYGPGSDCIGPLDPPCEPPGACCDPGGVCREGLNEFGCDGIEGYFYGPGTDCLGPLDPPCTPVAVDALINEVLATQDDVDEWEFLELLGTPFGLMDDMTVLVIEGQTASKGIIDVVIDLSGHQIGQEGYFVLGDTAVSPDLVVGASNIFENGSETFLLVKDLPGGVGLGTDVDTDNDGVADISVGTVMDAVGLVGGSGYPDYAIYYGAPEVGPQEGSFPAGGARIPNGLDTDTSGDWSYLSGTLNGSDGDHPITPGQANCGVGDFDQDGDRDLEDFAAFQRCFTGPGGGPPATGCEEGDLDADDDVDLDDHDVLADNLTGP